MTSRTANLALNAITGVITTAAIVLGGARAWEWVHPINANAGPHTRVVKRWRQYGTSGIRVGPSSATVTVVEFADFQCPFCRAASPVLDSLLRQYPTQLALVYRHYAIHPLAMPAAVASQCAARYGKFLPYHDLLFAKQDSIGKLSWASFAKQAGVEDSTGYATCLSDSSVARLVAADTLAAHGLGVDGTPTFLINDLEVMGYPGPDSLEKYIERRLADNSK